jgi:tripartite-type tricarboxylate transporter receptor subunit TctC
MKRRELLSLAASTALASLGLPASAQGLLGDGKVIRIVTGFPPGGSVDGVARVVAERMHALLGTTVIVDPKPGAGARIAVEHVKDAKPDGLTLLLTPASMMTLYPATFKKLRYDPLNDLVPVSRAVDLQVAFIAAPTVPANTFAEYVNWVKQDLTNRAVFAIPSEGSIPHFTVMSIATSAGLPFKPVPYKGTAPMVTDLLGGHVPVGINPVADVADHHKSGKLKVLAVGGTERSPLLPQVPTLAELGQKVVGGVEWYGFFAPKGTPQAIISSYTQVLKTILESPDVKAQFSPRGWQTHPQPPEPFAADIRRELETWRNVVAQTGYTPLD